MDDTDLKSQGIDGKKLPRHIAIIMDGNGRWAKKRGKPRIFGHRVGMESVRDVVRTCAEIGIEYLTLYTFSVENWKRPKEEVNALMQMLVDLLRDELEEFNERNVKILAIGRIQDLPAFVQKTTREDAPVHAKKYGTQTGACPQLWWQE